MKPILFNTQMVQAILEGRKTNTRRIIKDVSNLFYLGNRSKNYDAVFSDKKVLNSALLRYKKPPCYVGDILYVRETWMIQSMKNYEKNVKFLYKARPTKLNEVHVSNKRYEEMLKFECKNGWQPSLFMPKEAARIFLKVTSVKIEKLQDITHKGVIEEGTPYDEEMFKFNICLGQNKAEFFLKSSFKDLWNSTLNKDQLNQYGWNANPWVWVIEFERIDKSEAEQ